MLSSSLFTEFLKLSQGMTLVSLVMLILAFILMYIMEKKKINFSLRMLIALILGVGIGVLIQTLSGFPNTETINSTIWLQETISWYGLFGSAFVSFIKMLVFPIIFVSLIQVIITFKSDFNFSVLVQNALFWLMFTTGIATIVGIILALLSNLGTNVVIENTGSQARQVNDITGVLLNLIPANPIKAINDDNVIAIVIFASLVGSSARIMRSKEKYQRVMDLFADFIDALYRIVMSMAMTIIKFMPYGVIALMSRTLISYGVAAIKQALLFIALIYLASFVMFFVYSILLLAKGLNPITFFRKAVPALLMAFSSRSSSGSLPMTIATLEEKLGVNTGTANFVASLGSTMGMNGCAGYFPGMIAVMVAVMTGIPIDASFILMVIIIAILGSLGIAGIPGGATMAASIMLTGIGMGDQFHLLALVIAIDPIIDMARTMTNVNGTMVSAVCIDKKLGTLDLKTYNS
ncbi:MAG: cation:dicarboxylate symporter family transporter [Brevinema sp.]